MRRGFQMSWAERMATEEMPSARPFYSGMTEAATRARQGKLEEAIVDFNKAMEICPWSVDPVLNRGVALEGLGRFDDAIRDYRALLKVAPYDPAGACPWRVTKARD